MAESTTTPGIAMTRGEAAIGFGALTLLILVGGIRLTLLEREVQGTTRAVDNMLIEKQRNPDDESRLSRIEREILRLQSALAKSNEHSQKGPTP